MRREARHSDLEDKIVAGLDQLSSDLNDQMVEVITSTRSWPEGFGVTRRRNGEVVVGSNRNIVDLGNLQKSQSMERNGLTTKWEWDGMGETPPVLVHEGATLANGGIIPPRRWTEKAIEEINIQRSFEKGFNNE